MKMKMNQSIRTIGMVCLMSLVSVSAQAKNFRFATNVSDDSTAGLLIGEFADAVADRTDGRVKFKLFNNSVLGDQPQYLQQIQNNVIDAGLVNSGTLENVVPAVGVMNLPYIFRTSEEYGKVMTAPEVTTILSDAYADKGIAPLGFISSGFRSIYSKEPISGFSDLEGMKLRSIASPTYSRMLTLFGAVPTPLPFGDLYAGLQQGIVDGAEGGLAGLYSAKFGEVAKYAIATNQTRLTDFIVTSARFREALSPEDLAIVDEEFKKVSLKSIDFADENEAQDLAKAVAEMGVTVTEVDTTPFMEAVNPMYEEARADAAKKPLIDAIFALTGR